MERRTLLRSLLASVIAAPVLGAYETTVIALVEADDERYMRQAIRLAGNVPKFPFGAVLVDREKGVVVAEGWNRSVHNPTLNGLISRVNAKN